MIVKGILYEKLEQVMWLNVISNEGTLTKFWIPQKFGKFFSNWISTISKKNSTEEFVSRSKL
jgi:hypothetical protein